MCLIWRSSGSGSRSDSWAKAWAEIKQREMASKTKHHGVRRKSFGAEYVSMQLPPVFTRTFILTSRYTGIPGISISCKIGTRICGKEFLFLQGKLRISSGEPGASRWNRLG